MGDLLVHDWIEVNGGAEKVLDSLVETFPEAQILSLWNDAPKRYAANKVIESPLARTPLRAHKAVSVPVQALAWRAAMLGRRDVDRIIVSSHAFAHHVGHSSVPKYVYVHTPARYVWEPDLDKRGNHPLVRGMASFIRPMDRRRARQATSLAANSEFVRNRISRCWGMEASVIYPPVDTERIQSVNDWREFLSGPEVEVVEALHSPFVLGASRFVEYKRLDLVIRAGELVGMPVVLAGKGPDYPRLRAIAEDASVPVTFVDSPSDALLYSLYQMTSAFIFPPVEDFGIMPVEAMAAGAPVLCNSIGGAGESIKKANVGAQVDFADTVRLKELLSQLIASGARVQPGAMDDFAPKRFQDRINQWINSN